MTKMNSMSLLHLSLEDEDENVSDDNPPASKYSKQCMECMYKKEM